MERVEALPLTHIHAFTYSRRDGTPSATMKPVVPGDVAKRRHRELTAKVREKNLAFRRALTGPLQVLVESEKEGKQIGLDQYFNRVAIESGRDLRGEWVTLEDFDATEEMNRARL